MLMKKVYGFIMLIILVITLTGCIGETDYTVYFNTNGGSEIFERQTLEGEYYKEPLDPIKEGYIFEGWYTDPELSDLFDFNTKAYADVQLYAKWTEIDEKIDSELNDLKSNQFQLYEYKNLNS